MAKKMIKVEVLCRETTYGYREVDVPAGTPKDKIMEMAYEILGDIEWDGDMNTELVSVKTDGKEIYNP